MALASFLAASLAAFSRAVMERLERFAFIASVGRSHLISKWNWLSNQWEKGGIYPLNIIVDGGQGDSFLTILRISWMCRRIRNTVIVSLDQYSSSTGMFRHGTSGGSVQTVRRR